MSAFKSSAVVGSSENEMCEDHNTKGGVGNGGQVQNLPIDNLLPASAPASDDVSLLQVGSHSGKLEDRDKEEINLTTIDDDAPSSDIGLDNSTGDLSWEEDRIHQDQSLNDTSGSTFRSSNMVNGTIEELRGAQADGGDMEKEVLMQNAPLGETSDMFNPSKPAADLLSVPAESSPTDLEVENKDEPLPTEVLVSSVRALETASSNIDVALDDAGNLTVREVQVDQEIIDSAPPNVPGFISHLFDSEDTISQDVRKRSLDNNSAPTLRSAAKVDSARDGMFEGQASKDYLGNETHNLLVDGTSLLSAPSEHFPPSELSAPSEHVPDSSLTPSESHSGKLENYENEHPALVEVHVSDLPFLGSAPSITNTALDNLGAICERENGVIQESKEPSSSDISGLDVDLPASVETCGEDVKEKPLDENLESALGSSDTVGSSEDEMSEGQANKEVMEKEDQMQNMVMVSAPLAPIAPTSELLSAAANSHLGKMEDQEKEDPTSTEVFVPSLTTMGTAPTTSKIPSDNSENTSAEEDADQETNSPAICGAPGLHLDLPASFGTCSEDVKAQSPDDSSASHLKCLAITDGSADKTCETLITEEEEEKECHERTQVVNETPSQLAPGTPASDSLLDRVDSRSEKPEDGEKNGAAVSEVPGLATLLARIGIAVSSCGDPSGKEDIIDEESKGSSQCHISELKPDLPVSSIKSCESHASVSACLVDSTITELCKNETGMEEGGKVGEVKGPSEVFASDMLMGGHGSHYEESVGGKQKDPARS